jgi:hypothetical protein
MKVDVLWQIAYLNTSGSRDTWFGSMTVTGNITRETILEGVIQQLALKEGCKEGDVKALPQTLTYSTMDV